MTCPACGHENIPGEDVCVRCEEPLMQEDVPQPETPFQRSIMTDPIQTLRPTSANCVPAGSSLAGAIAQMKAVNKGYVCVTNPDGTLAGLFTERDMIEKVAGLIEDLSGVTVDSVMNPRVTALPSNVPIAHSLHVMSIHGYRLVPLVDDAGRVNAVVSFRQVLNYIQEMV